MTAVMNEQQYDIDDEDGAQTDLSARDHVSALISGARELAVIELDFYRARLSYSKKMVQRAGLFGLIAIFFLFAATIALVLGALLIAAAFFGPYFATLLVSAGFIAIAALFGLLARANMRKLSFPELAGDDNNEPG
jgi:fatty acid desaturase